MQILTCLGLLILSVVGPALATPSSGDVFVASKDGTSIYANAAGNPANPAVVFVHALGYSSVGFDDYFEDLELLK
jgi:pimeloyl-ACP methyl ester carboxylesterase